MKKIILVMAIALTSVWAVAQEDSPEEIKTLFGNKGDQSIGGYGGIHVNYGAVNGTDAIFIGGRGAVVLNHSLAIGLGGNGFISETVSDEYLNEDYEFAGGYGGIIIEPIIGAKKPIHVSFPMLVGAGGIGYVKHWGEYDEFDDEHDYTNYAEDNTAFFIFEPGIELEFNLVKFMRVAVTGSYRLTSNVNLKYKDRESPETGFAVSGNSIGGKDMMRGFNFGLIMKFGKF